MKKILLMCMGGFSTGLLVEKMKNVAKENGESVDIKAISTSSLDEVAGDYDCLLLAPQINYLAEDVKSKYPELPLYLIQPMDYGRLNAQKILTKAMDLMKQGDDEK